MGFTQALFTELAESFNGDLFALGSDALHDIDPERLSRALNLLRRLLVGDTDVGQPKLFVWAYEFEVVPLSLISSIYEEFYHSTKKDDGTPNKTDEDDNTHYTPVTLVHNVLARILTPEILRKEPRILDPACGSGVFLVEAFRRIVRFKAQDLGRRLAGEELRSVLRHQLAGIEIESEAARVAAFSLYLALLDQQLPPDILQGGPLPHLIHRGVRDEQHYGVVVVGNAFDLTAAERQELSDRLVGEKRFEGRRGIERLLQKTSALDLELHSFDIVLGNPPWQEISDGTVQQKSWSHGSTAVAWAEAFDFPVGDKSYSQFFLYRTLTFLRLSGRAGLLVSAKILWNTREGSQNFRRSFLSRVRLQEIVNFTHVRKVFFAGGTAPFVLLHFESRGRDEQSGMLVYWSARHTKVVDRLKSVAFTRVDRRVVRQTDLESADHLWKTYWWGNHHDAALVARLGLERTLGELLEDRVQQPAYGWQRGGERPSRDVAKLRELRSRDLTPYGPLQPSWFREPPTGVKRDPNPRIYRGQRLIATRGVKEPFGPVVRLETKPFSFRHTILSVPLPGLTEAETKLLLGIAWSSLARYRLFMTSGSWGGWSHQVTKEDVLAMPLRLAPSWGMSASAHADASERIIAAVEQLREWKGGSDDKVDLFSWQDILEDHRSSRLVRSLDEAVFDLFELSNIERDLVRDFWAYSHDLFWKESASEALQPILLPKKRFGTARDLAPTPPLHSLERYISAFLTMWNNRVEPEAEFSWRATTSAGNALLAVVFSLGPRGAEATKPSDTASDLDEWQALVNRCADHLQQRITPALIADRIVRVITDRYFIVLKSSERRRWSASAAREDAEAILLQAMRLPDAMAA